MSAPLFDVEPAAVRPKPSGDARRIHRQAEAMHHRQHPLAVALNTSIPLHPDAPVDPHDRHAPGLRCGGCRFRGANNSGTAQAFTKCWWRPGDTGPRPRISRGPGTDVRKWWPACRDFEPRSAR